jgi:hypothetical protein
MNRDAERALVGMTVSEIGALALVAFLLASSLFGDGFFLADTSRTLRAAALGFVVFELLVPLWVYVDIRRQAEPPDRVWIHVAAMPVINLFGLVAYLVERSRR